MIHKVGIKKFIELLSYIPVADVRSPSEYSHAHIRGAINIPLFSDQERAIIGTIYKKQGQNEAVLSGMEFAGKKIRVVASEGLRYQKNGQILVHCWRGGMRSEAMAWIFEKAGLECFVLNGGYKAFRNYALSYFSKDFRLNILGGLTGSGKTEILHEIRRKNLQAIDLEGIAGHKGSAFGALGEPAQKSNEQFENDLFSELSIMDIKKIIWIEDESRNIGRNVIPGDFFITMSQSPLIHINVPLKLRINRLVESYSLFPEEDIISCLNKISRRIGGWKASKAARAFKEKQPAVTAELILDYYDKSYNHSIKCRINSNIVYLDSDSDNHVENADKILKVKIDRVAK